MAKKDRRLKHLPPVVAEYIESVIKKMRYRRKVLDEVRAELAAHFEDALRDPPEKDELAKKLVTEFGDVKLLGVLARRAKKRCRPLWRTIAARTFQAFGIFVVCLIVYLVWFLTGKPNITTDYVAEINRMVRPTADDGLNAGPFYHKAAEMLPETPGKFFDSLSIKEIDTEQRQIIEKWLIDNEEALQLVIAGTGKPYYWQEYGDKQNSGEMLAILMPNLSKFKDMGRAFGWRALLRAQQGKYKEAFGDLKASYQLGQHIKRGVTLIEQLVGMAIENISVNSLRKIVSEYEIDTVTLTNLQRDYEEMAGRENFVVSSCCGKR